jgi:hypothetical protein
VEAQNIIRVEPVAPKASTSSGEKPAAAPERKTLAIDEGRAVSGSARTTTTRR